VFLSIGDKLEEGDLLAEIETDKATMGFDTPEEGYLAKILIPAGTTDIPIGQLIAIIVLEEKDIEAFKDYVDIAPPISRPLPIIPPDVTPPIVPPVISPELIPVPITPEVLIAYIISLYSLFRI
jgi:pyruvate dehydrogenase E2 component (dihydrolipoamide acetyltransferase)